MNAPDDCPYVVMPTSRRSSGAGRPITCSCNLSRGTADESEAYFFRRRSCFGDDVVVRASRSGGDLQICCSYQRLYHPIERMQKPLTPADWTRVEEGLEAASFWTLDPIEEFRPMFDGSDWTIRGHQGVRSHCIKRRSPYGRSAISASCSSNWPDRKRLTNVSNIQRHSRYDHKIAHTGSGLHRQLSGSDNLGACIHRRSDFRERAEGSI
jgi:hypothetical protein